MNCLSLHKAEKERHYNLENNTLTWHCIYLFEGKAFGIVMHSFTHVASSCFTHLCFPLISDLINRHISSFSSTRE